MTDTISIYLIFIKYLKELNRKDKELDSIYDEMDPLLIGGGISLDQAYEEEFSKIILPYNTKKYTIDQAREILMKYASIYPEVVKHMKEYKKMVDNDLDPQSLKFNLQISTKRRSLMRKSYTETSINY